MLRSEAFVRPARKTETLSFSPVLPDRDTPQVSTAYRKNMTFPPVPTLPYRTGGRKKNGEM